MFKLYYYVYCTQYIARTSSTEFSHEIQHNCMDPAVLKLLYGTGVCTVPKIRSAYLAAAKNRPNI